MRLVKLTLIVAPDLSALTTFASTLTELTARRGRVHIAVHSEPPPGADVSAFSGKFRRLTIGSAPALDRWSVLGSAVRGCLDCWRLLESPSGGEAAYRRALQEAPPLAARLAESRWLRSRPIRPLATAVLRAVERAIPSPPPLLDFLRQQNPDLLVVAPVFGIGTITTDYLRAANELGIPTMGLARRWDDLTDGARVHMPPDCIALWNRDQRRQAVEILGIPARRTAVIGACLPLDAAGTVETTRDEFCQRHGLGAARANVLLAPRAQSGDAPEWIRRCVERLRSSSDTRTREANVLVYVAPPPGVQQIDHPIGHVVVPRSDSDPKQYAFDVAEALHHADVVVAADMGLVLEAAARARPLVAALGPDGDADLARFSAGAAAQRGWPLIAGDLDQCVASVTQLLSRGLDAAVQANVRTLVRPHGTDLSPGFLMWARLVQEVIDRRAEPRTVPTWVRWLRAALGPVANAAVTSAAALPARRERLDNARILVGVPSAESLSLHQPVIRMLAERGHQLRIVYTARRGQSEDVYARIRCDVPGVVPVGLLTPPSGVWASIAQGLLGLSLYLSLLDRRRRSAPTWLVRLSTTLLPVGARPVARLARQMPRLRPSLSRIVARLDRAVPPSPTTCDLLGAHQPDLVLVLPDNDVVTAIDSAAAQADLIRAASSLDTPSVAIACGCDGQLHATLLQPRPSSVFVWNAEQRDRVIRDIPLEHDRVIVTGAALLDRCLDGPPILDELEFRTMLGLPAGQPFALFAGSVGLLSEPGRDVNYVRRWLASLRASTDPALRNLAVLIRPPVGAARWRALDLAGLDNVVLCPRSYERSGELDVVLLAESVRYAAVTIGIDGLALTMAAALGQPAVALLRPEAAKDAADAWPLEFLWTARDSSVIVATSVEELNERLHAVVANNARARPNPFLGTFVRPHPRAQPSTVAADHIERIARGSRRRGRPRTAAGAAFLRAPLLLIAGAVDLVGRLRPSANR